MEVENTAITRIDRSISLIVRKHIAQRIFRNHNERKAESLRQLLVVQ
jgi:hypothetical protein